MIWEALDLQTKRRIVSWILAVTFLLLLAGCANDVESTASHTDETPVGTTMPQTDIETQRIAAPDPDDDLNGPVYTVQPFLPEEDPMASEIEAAMAAKEAKLIWAEGCFLEPRQEVKIWHYSVIDCNELYEEMLKELFPDATVESREETLDGLRLALKSGQTSFGCMVDINGYYINFFQLPSGLGETLLPKTADWLSKRTGVEQHKWTDFDTMRTDAIACYTGQVDGIQIGALYCLQLNNQLQGNYGVCLSPSGNIEFCSPISVGEEAGTVKLNGSFSLEDLRATLEFDFDPSLPEITVYRSCRLCYLIHEEKGLLVPVWWVKGVRYNLETGEGRPFEVVFDAETGSKYRLGGA